MTTYLRNLIQNSVRPYAMCHAIVIFLQKTYEESGLSENLLTLLSHWRVNPQDELPSPTRKIHRYRQFHSQFFLVCVICSCCGQTKRTGNIVSARQDHFVIPNIF